MTTKTDIHTEHAAKLFSVEPSKVTKDQRRVAKAWAYSASYSAGGVKESLLVGCYPVKITLTEENNT